MNVFWLYNSHFISSSVSVSVSEFSLDRKSTALLSQQEEKQFRAELKSPELVKADR